MALMMGMVSLPGIVFELDDHYFDRLAVYCGGC
jgi:hypothetical protein